MAPRIVPRLSELFEQALIFARHAELHLVHARQLVEAHEFIIGPDFGRVCPYGHHARDFRHNRHRAEALEHRNALVTLDHIKAAHELHALDRVMDTAFVQLRFTQADPLGGKLRIFRQDRHIVPCKGELSPGCQRTGHQRKRNVDRADQLLPGYLRFAHQIVQDRGIRAFSLRRKGIVIFLAGFQSRAVLLNRIRSRHALFSPKSFIFPVQ